MPVVSASFFWHLTRQASAVSGVPSTTTRWVPAAPDELADVSEVAAEPLDEVPSDELPESEPHPPAARTSVVAAAAISR